MKKIERVVENYLFLYYLNRVEQTPVEGNNPPKSLPKGAFMYCFTARPEILLDGKVACVGSWFGAKGKTYVGKERLTNREEAGAALGEGHPLVKQMTEGEQLLQVTSEQNGEADYFVQITQYCNAVDREGKPI